jgi:OOP family OmpA-OmpF porin
MKKSIFTCSLLLLAFFSRAQLGNMGGILKDKISNKVKEKANERSEKDKNKTGDTQGNDRADTIAPVNAGNNTQGQNPVLPQNVSGNEVPALKVYQNYDFIPGDKVLFEDDFSGDQAGEFPAQWKLKSGQAVINQVGTGNAFLLTDGNYAEVSPRIKTSNYLSGNFTVEFDFIFARGSDGGYGYQPIVRLYYVGAEGFETSFEVGFGMNEVVVDQLNKSYPQELKEGFGDKWHHAALVLKNGQMKTYVDQYRICVNPNADLQFNHLAFVGIGSEITPVIFKNVRIAEGGGMNLIGKKFTDAKIVTRGITFDVNKASIKPESMGTLNMIAKVMTENPELKFEVGGHTDADGDEAANIKLSQQRAEAVKMQLIGMGINAARLTAKGFGESKPVSDNTSSEGKANNRRVEFVKQ